MGMSPCMLMRTGRSWAVATLHQRRMLQTPTTASPAAYLGRLWSSSSRSWCALVLMHDLGLARAHQAVHSPVGDGAAGAQRSTYVVEHVD